MTNEEKGKKLKNYYRSVSPPSIKILGLEGYINFLISETDDGSSNSVPVDSAQEVIKIYDDLKFTFKLSPLTTLLNGNIFKPEYISQYDFPAFLKMEINSDLEYYEKIIESVKVLHNIGVTWELFYEVLLEADGEYTIDEWTNKTGVKKDQFERIFDHHLHRSKSLSTFNGKSEQPSIENTKYAKKIDDKFYLEKPTKNLDSFKYEYLLFKCLESQKKPVNPPTDRLQNT